mmetsp:Transcript_6557/g.10481  ORF Transcript_6557/g.10481 Transcript_6557/m.10481 type:complete len:102 (-) Transcript_6557:8-313(-)
MATTSPYVQRLCGRPFRSARVLAAETQLDIFCCLTLIVVPLPPALGTTSARCYVHKWKWIVLDASDHGKHREVVEECDLATHLASRIDFITSPLHVWCCFW